MVGKFIPTFKELLFVFGFFSISAGRELTRTYFHSFAPDGQKQFSPKIVSNCVRIMD